jgi:uncharacterized DUF497 family protein
VVRGGSFNNNTRNLRVSNRNNNSPANRNNNFGFRCAREVERATEVQSPAARAAAIPVAAGVRSPRPGPAPGHGPAATEHQAAPALGRPRRPRPGHCNPARVPLEREDNRLYTDGVRFEWDPSRAGANLRAHGVSFAEAVTVLEDARALTREDVDAADEPRFVPLGLSNLGNLLVVVYAYREPDGIRVISAWKASRRQRGQYEEGRG